MWQTDPNFRALFTSKRFWAAIAAIVVVVVQQWFPSIPDSAVTNAVMIISSWIIGETFRPVIQNPPVDPPATGIFNNGNTP